MIHRLKIKFKIIIMVKILGVLGVWVLIGHINQQKVKEMKKNKICKGLF